MFLSSRFYHYNSVKSKIIFLQTEQRYLYSIEIKHTHLYEIVKNNSLASNRWKKRRRSFCPDNFLSMFSFEEIRDESQKTRIFGIVINILMLILIRERIEPNFVRLRSTEFLKSRFGFGSFSLSGSH